MTLKNKSIVVLLSGGLDNKTTIDLFLRVISFQLIFKYL